MDRQSKIQLLNDLLSGKRGLDALKKRDDFSKFTYLELKILSAIVRKPGNSNRGCTLSDVLTFDLEANERLFIEHLIAISKQREPNHGQNNPSKLDEELMCLPQPERITSYLTAQSHT